MVWSWNIEIDHRQYKILHKKVTLTNSSTQFYIIYLEQKENDTNMVHIGNALNDDKENGL